MNAVKRWADRGAVRYVLGRILQAVGVLWAAYTLTFFILWSVPGDVMTNITGGRPTDIPDEQLAEIAASWGLDKPLLVRYVDSLVAALSGDFGVSFATGQSVSGTILRSLPPTVEIAAAGFALGIALGATTAILATRARSRHLRGFLLSLPPLGVAIPSFWLGLLLIQFLSFTIPAFPAYGNAGPFSLVLPAITLAIPLSAYIAQLLSSGLQHALQQPYADTARAKGAGPRRVQLAHALRNAALPAFTAAGLLVGSLLGGAVVVETVFSRDGLGRITAAAVAAKDIPMVLGVVVFTALVFVVVNLLVDLAYSLLDPRIGKTLRPLRRQPIGIPEV